jgi:hypothetical protein
VVIRFGGFSPGPAHGFRKSLLFKGLQFDERLTTNRKGFACNGLRFMCAGPGPVPGVDESGFHNRELSGDKPCRWTNGNAKVIVPVPDGRRWRTLAVKAEIPDRPDYRVRLTVNGRVLFDDVAKPGRVWSKEFPLDGIDLDRKAVIELTSSTIPPGQTRTKDDRTLGIRLRELILNVE